MRKMSTRFLALEKNEKAMTMQISRILSALQDNAIVCADLWNQMTQDLEMLGATRCSFSPKQFENHDNLATVGIDTCRKNTHFEENKIDSGLYQPRRENDIVYYKQRYLMTKEQILEWPTIEFTLLSLK